MFVYIYMGIYVKTGRERPQDDGHLSVRGARAANLGRFVVAKAFAEEGVHPGLHPGKFSAGPLLRHLSPGLGSKKRKGDFSCETSPSLFRFSEIRFGVRITTWVFPESLGTYELTLACSSLF
jgi:hypothetical protein